MVMTSVMTSWLVTSADEGDAALRAAQQIAEESALGGAR